MARIKLQQQAFRVNPREALFDLNQESDVDTYIDQFKAIYDRSGICDSHGKSLFLGGLDQEIACQVRMLNPHSLEEAMVLARNIEYGFSEDEHEDVHETSVTEEVIVQKDVHETSVTEEVIVQKERAVGEDVVKHDNKTLSAVNSMVLLIDAEVIQIPKSIGNKDSGKLAFMGSQEPLDYLDYYAAILAQYVHNLQGNRAMDGLIIKERMGIG